MISTKDPLIFLVLLKIFILPLFITAHAITNNCNRSCGSNRTFSYPFGFSAGCEIHLNCTTRGEVFIGEFPVRSVDSHSIKVDVQRNCTRPLNTLHQLFSHRYAPTYRNAILLENCSNPFSNCVLPEILLPTNFDSLNCSFNSKVSCYTDNKSLEFIDFESVKQNQCHYLLSSISSSESTNLEILVMELGWWLDGNCPHCDPNANCTPVRPPDGHPGYRCNCKKGFAGDGYLAGTGCRKG